jgi:hypothetical protein
LHLAGLMAPIVDGLADWAERSHLPVQVLSVDTLEGSRSATQARTRLAPYLAEAQEELPVLLDLDGSLHEELGSGLPFVAIIDRSGRLAATYSGLEPRIAEELRDRVAALASHPIASPTAKPEARSAHPRL